ncbi:fumarylacetoacetate hydrolase family protein [Sphingobium sp. D43FB]|jgi:2-keto-4-pentenoate hydratase/2-oxohepta-3-ene-1,7-dioic acid hydratase in catechol pathway|uniref:fumarylacetoacetate hydrolase family protein n=1 Tax=Sphingobium sp. D43FB TaxID=2017595 RepID=UPI000BB597C0|nr:fumarylacetoacetate hydrolase family protein [Sphingobium sp. D43FB]PBN43331.1 5-carboxymethyl-2-hydroxymuconate isomerase [Sphingobium sp. D43FB]
MRYVSFRRPDGTASFGRIDGETIVELAGEAVPSLKAALTDGSLATLADGATFAVADVVPLPVIPDPAKILCVGLNYAEHVKETGREQKAHPAIFVRYADSLVADGQPMVKPTVTERFDYEGELAVVIGKPCHKITAADAMAYVAGYSAFNDGSARDWQRHNIQFTPGKTFPGTGGFGPALVTADEIDDLGALRVQTRLNGELVQDQAIADMIWDIPTVIEYISAFTPLAPGDVIATGTPGGVGDKRTPPLYMNAGDKVEVSIGTIGTLTNRIIDEA